jgi:hypothetical protein
MSDSGRLAYDEFSTPQQMHADAEATERNLASARRLPRLERAARAAVEPAPSIHFEDYPREVSKRDIEVSDAAARLANALHLHLD